ncbi:hypothetical protein PFISCL1PPCAC_28638 [Pristionchus fissidentatus]|uniref:protein-serine/threonine phosphatase n=1 Tax=Pristionchus fissidentatus TaxID=1538716 RepID=A0AAV5X1L9_9BILA|nr:hypothetical protein PFISCL1PPCAC_9067 [Pristionchus fissidentatus]GMT37341.1 hypothetical protein PFISCL1PPCAC_28638 [Pristionchus fissidentatus]
MGAYLNKPITEKHSESGGTDKIKFAATSMQGWRINQEDAHNCIINLEDGWHVFAVYDGHGGPEVAKYTALNFPQFFKDREVWKAEDIVKLLQDTFVDFDDHLRTEPVMKELKKIAAGDANEEKGESDDDDEGDEDKAALFEEGTAPLEQLLKKYGYEIISNGGTTRVMRHITDVANEHMAEARAAKQDDAGDSEDGEGSSSAEKPQKRPNSSPRLQRAKRAKSEISAEEEKNGEEEKEEKKTEGDAKSEEEKIENGEEEKPVVTEVKKGANTVPVNKPAAKSEGGALDDVDVNSSDDEDYKEGEEEEGEDEEGDDEDESEEEDEDEEGEEDEDEDEEMDEDAFGGLSGASFGPSGETPGEDSGTTACVCLVAPGKVIVANAGDSRAVLSRGGKAIDLSIDHKPEDQIEMDRITKAGGIVNEDGRVNGGLNLSRALGDHCYKKNKTLPLREQMISALPDVKILETTDEDDFIVVACDGIWNSLESQQVVDFVKERLVLNKSLTEICEEMCTACLADSTSGDGTGCDNMTIIVADLKAASRPAPAAAAEKNEEEAVQV